MTPRSKEHLKVVSAFGCVVCGRNADAHHAIGRRGMGVKPSDFGTVPLCRMHHTECHRMGKNSFQKAYHVDFAEVVANILHHKVTGEWLTMVL